MKKRWIITALTLLSVASAYAQDASSVRQWAATCASCHGTDGRSVGGIPPSLAGRPKSELVQTLLDFKSGKRPATIMHQLAKGYSDAQLEAVATYLSAQKPN